MPCFKSFVEKKNAIIVTRHCNPFISSALVSFLQCACNLAVILNVLCIFELSGRE